MRARIPDRLILSPANLFASPTESYGKAREFLEEMRRFEITANQDGVRQGGSQSKRNVANTVARRKRQVLKRLERTREPRFIRGLDSTTVIGANAMTDEISAPVHALSHGGIRMMLKLLLNTLKHLLV